MGRTMEVHTRLQICMKHKYAMSQAAKQSAWSIYGRFYTQYRSNVTPISI
jgi:hypothetical protein